MQPTIEGTPCWHGSSIDSPGLRDDLEIFVVIGLVVSTVVRRRADAALVGILIWVILVFAIPRLVSLLVNGVRPPSRSVELALRRDAIESQLKLDCTRRQKAAFAKYLSMSVSEDMETAVADFRREVELAMDEMLRKRRVLLAQVWEDLDRDELLRQRYVSAFSTLSPTAILSNMAAELSWTGYAQRDHFYRESRAYDENFGRKLAESRRVFFAETGQSGAGKAVVTRIDVRPYLSPAQSTWVNSAEILKTVMVPVALLVIIGAALYTFAQSLFARLDVRL